MEQKLLLLLAGVVLGIGLYWAKAAFRRYRLERQARARLAAYVPRGRSIPLSAQDRRGWATDSTGWMRPR